MYETECPHCNTGHDLEALEPSFRRPDEYLTLVRRDDVEYIDNKDACAVRAVDGSFERYFMRVLIPFAVSPLVSPLSWGAWVEVTAQQWERVGELWDDPDQAEEPAFVARLANDIPLYEDALSILGHVLLSDPANIPTFHMTTPQEHRFVIEQQSGVTARRAAEWLVMIYHPEVLAQMKIEKILARRTAPPNSA